MKQEMSRTRQHGTRITNTNKLPDPGAARIQALRDIVKERRYAKIDGRAIDSFSAAEILDAYDTLSPEKQTEFRDLSIHKMITRTFIGRPTWLNFPF